MHKKSFNFIFIWIFLVIHGNETWNRKIDKQKSERLWIRQFDFVCTCMFAIKNGIHREKKTHFYHVQHVELVCKSVHTLDKWQSICDPLAWHTAIEYTRIQCVTNWFEWIVYSKQHKNYTFSTLIHIRETYKCPCDDGNFQFENVENVTIYGKMVFVLSNNVNRIVMEYKV